jgi:hypothetical protein
LKEQNIGYFIQMDYIESTSGVGMKEIRTFLLLLFGSSWKSMEMIGNFNRDKYKGINGKIKTNCTYKSDQ